jgi:hypothetical protein
MTTEESYNEIHKMRSASIDKYVYYLIAIMVAAIGYSIDITKDDKLSIETAPMLTALICWGISFTCGCLFIRTYISTLGLNMLGYLLTKDTDKKENMKRFNSESSKMDNLYKKQLAFLGIGIFFFVAWYLLHLYINSFLICPYHN